jgi:hypothetical protein
MLTDKIILDYSEYDNDITRGYFAGDELRAGSTLLPDNATASPLPLNYVVEIKDFQSEPEEPPLFYTSITRNTVTRDLFAGSMYDGSLNWDFNQTWRWDAAKGRPAFLSER